MGVRPALFAGVYPRVCGATVDSAFFRIVDGGLSPRVRGHLPALHVVVADVGSIPACAGPPAACRPPSPKATVYPRVCGATWGTKPRTPRRTGLSPRVRGHLPVDFPGGGRVRSIPACAGPPAAIPTRRVQVEVYPRVCGATMISPSAVPSCTGLSPRVRGHRTGRAGIARSSWVYPRVCGATMQCGPSTATCPGLSPRVRGHQSVK